MVCVSVTSPWMAGNCSRGWLIVVANLWASILELVDQNLPDFPPVSVRSNLSVRSNGDDMLVRAQFVGHGVDQDAEPGNVFVKLDGECHLHAQTPDSSMAMMDCAGPPNSSINSRIRA